MKRWSKLQKKLYSIVDTTIGFQIHCSRYRMKSQYGSTDLPRYWITLGDEIIFDYPKQFMNKSGAVNTMSHYKPNKSYPYVTDISAISDLIQSYIDTPKEDVFDKHFENDNWGLINILKAADRRIGLRRLKLLKRKTNNKAAGKIIELRLTNH